MRWGYAWRRLARASPTHTYFSEKSNRAHTLDKVDMDRIENVATLLNKNTMVLERHFSVAPDTLWNAIATKEGLSHWFMPTKFEIARARAIDLERGMEEAG